MVLEPGELHPAGADLVHGLDSGWVSNGAAAANSWNSAADERYWRRLGRLNGYQLSMWGYIEDDSASVASAVELFRDEAAAAGGFDAWVSDVYFARDAGVSAIAERPLPGIGDEAILLSAEVPETGSRLAIVLTRRGPVVGTVVIWRKTHSADEEAEALTRLLDDRVHRAIEGQLVAVPVPVPGAFVSRQRLPRAEVLNDPARAEPIADEGCPGAGRRVCLMGLGDELGVDLEEFAEHFRSTYDLEVAVLPTPSLEGHGGGFPNIGDYDRQRIDSISLWELVHDLYPVTTADPEVAFIVVSAYDYYDVERPGLNYFYRMRDEQSAIVSNARFDDASFGMPQNPEALRTRTLKLVAREIGVLHFGLPIDVSDDRHSLMQTFPAPWGIDRFSDVIPVGMPVSQAQQ